MDREGDGGDGGDEGDDGRNCHHYVPTSITYITFITYITKAASLSFRPQLTILIPIDPVDREAEGGPDGEAPPGVGG